MKTYNKLIRDKIPEIIRADNAVPVTRKLGVKDYKKELLKKLVEEAQEAVESENKEELINELADMQEIMTAIYGAFKIECGDVTKHARKKRKERGAFTKRIFLEKVK